MAASAPKSSASIAVSVVFVWAYLQQLVAIPGGRPEKAQESGCAVYLVLLGASQLQMFVLIASARA